MDGVKGAIDLLVQFIKAPIFGGWLSIWMIVIGFVVYEVAIKLWRYFSEKLGY